jgi:hypothetical protein
MSNKVSITDLLESVGSENIRFQDVMSSLENIKSKKGVTVISFATDAMSPSDVVAGTGPKGLVLWIDQSLMQQRLQELKAGNGLTYGKLLAQRDDLLSVLEELFTIGDVGHCEIDAVDETVDFEPWGERAKAAIAKAKGGAA